MIPELHKITLSVDGTTVPQLPHFSGVYRFYGKADDLLYVGKSVDIHTRVTSHFHEGRKPGRHQRIMSQVARIDCQPTAGEIGALLVENAAIKAETPMYNRRQRQMRKLWSIQLEQHSSGFLRPVAIDFSPTGQREADCYGLFANQKMIESSLRRHARDQGLCLASLGIEKARGPCFQFQLGRCDGACAGKETPDEHNARLVSVLSEDRIRAWPFAGAVTLLEYNANPACGQPQEQHHIIDNWAYLGSYATAKAACAALSNASGQAFDRDAYKLLMSTLRKGNITLLNTRSGKSVPNPFCETHAAGAA